MGNNHGSLESMGRDGERRQRIRRLSAPAKESSLELPNPHPHHTSFTFGGSMSRGASPLSSTPPKIQINGRDSDNDLQSHDGRPVFPTFSDTSTTKPASIRRMEFLTSCGSLTVRSLDDGNIADVELQMKPLTRTKSHSPLKQMRTYSFRSLNSEENALDQMHCSALHHSWKFVKERCLTLQRDFAFVVFERIFDRQPKLRTLFKVDAFESLSEVPLEHEFVRHSKLFTNILDLAIRNVEELEVQVAPVMFKYGERHFNGTASSHFTEETVRLFCGQVVCAVADMLGEGVEPLTMEAWIEMMRYLGRKLLDGYEYGRIGTKRRISINKNDHHLFLML